MSARTTTDWDGKAYDQLAAPQEEWARRVLERMPLEGAETVLDAGCGSGRATKLLLDKLPSGQVVGVDGSPSMIEVASETFAGDDRVNLITSDLLELTPALLQQRAGITSVDAVFSNATFHWIEDHRRLFERLHSVLRPEGRLVAQCGGRDNVTAWCEAILATSEREPFAEYVRGFRPWNFYGPEETEERLRETGFEAIDCWLEELPVVVPDDPRNFISACGLAVHRDRLPEDLRDPFTEAVIAQLEVPLELRYIRLNIDASRAGE
ncbi:MAG: class I SAM-dependent methyltransferase [Solirubrobacterales bacterium]